MCECLCGVSECECMCAECMYMCICIVYACVCVLCVVYVCRVYVHVYMYSICMCLCSSHPSFCVPLSHRKARSWKLLCVIEYGEPLTETQKDGLHTGLHRFFCYTVTKTGIEFYVMQPCREEIYWC